MIPVILTKSLGHDKLIFCLAVAHASTSNPERQTFLLENQRMKTFFFPSTKFLLEANIFTSFCLILPLLTLFLYSFINLDLHLSV